VLSADALSDLYANLADKYPIKSIEDPFDQDDFDAYEKFTHRVGSRI
jgi:enolase